MKEYSIIIPTYNESDKIGSTMNKVHTFMTGFAKDFEIIVVDDGSSDDTIKKVETFSQDLNNVVLIKNAHKGKGVALSTGVLHANGNFIYLCDADLSAPISEIKKLSIWIVDHDFDIVIASREGIGARRVGEPLYRHFMGRIFNLITQFIALRGLKDTQCGFKLFKGAVAKKLFSNLRIYTQQSRELNRPYMGAFDVEVLYLARKLKYSIKEVPVTWTYVATTRLAPLKDSIDMLRDIVKIRLNDMKGVYSNIK